MNLEKLKTYSIDACGSINDFSVEVLKTRGGRIGSGMGLLIEALWGYHMNNHLAEEDFEIGWFPGHQYNDFAILRKDSIWNSITRDGETCRIEVKSMNIDADESKGHFNVLKKEISPNDLLIVILWEWRILDNKNAVPIITDHYIGIATDLMILRDKLHLVRGGSFVSKDNCEEECTCQGDFCLYDGEPLNANGNRERKTGPPYAKKGNVSHSANFGGLIRMLKTNNKKSRDVFREFKNANQSTSDFVDFVYRQRFSV